MNRFVDSHIHFWDPALRRPRWLADGAPLNRRFSPATIELGGLRPEGHVFIEADCEPDEALAEAEWASGLATEQPPVLGVVAHAPVDDGPGIESQLIALARLPSVVGVRRLLQDEPIEVFRRSEMIDGLRLLPDFGFTFDACVRSDQLGALTRLAQACPETTIVLDHLGKPPIARDDVDGWRSDLKALADRPNVCCKLSGLATEAGPGWSSAAVQPYLGHAIAVFGPARCMFGSDWPVCLTATGYARWFEAVVDATHALSATERAAVLFDNADRTYRLQAGRTPEKNEHARG